MRQERANSFAVWSGFKRLTLGTFADIVVQTMNSKFDYRRPDPRLFISIAKAIFGPSGGGVHCRGVALEIPDGSLTTPVKEVCLQVCKRKEEIVPLNEGEQIVSELIAVGPGRDPLTAPVKLYLPLQDSGRTDQHLFLRWSPTQVSESVLWRDVFPGSCRVGRLAGPTARLQISSQQTKITTSSFGLFCIISQRSDSHGNDECDSKTGILFHGIHGLSEMFKRMRQRRRSMQSDQHAKGHSSEHLALIS